MPAILVLGLVGAPVTWVRPWALTQPVGSSLTRTVPDVWVRAFAEDFTNPTLPAGCSVHEGLPAGATASYYRPDEVRISGGLLRLGLHRRDFDGRPFTAGGIGCPALAQRYGRYEYRARVPDVAGVGAYALLWPEDDWAVDATVVAVRTPAGATGRRTAVVQVGDGPGQPGVELAVAGADQDGFRTYVIESSPAGLRVSVDGREVVAAARVPERRRRLSFVVGTGDDATGLPEPDSLPVEFTIDWLRVFSYGPELAGVGGAPGPVTGVDPAGSPGRAPGVGGLDRARLDQGGIGAGGAVSEGSLPGRSAVAGPDAGRPWWRGGGLVAGGALILLAAVAGALSIQRRRVDRGASHRV